jgi:hypothetical protein
VRPLDHRSCLAIIAALAAVAAVAGCSGGAQAPVNPTASSSSSVRHVGPPTTVTRVVGIKNDWVMMIIGSGSAMCWSISPSLPSVGAGDLSDPVTLSYTPLCPSPSTLPITYGPGPSSTADCIFHVGYNGTAFTYSVTQGVDTACTATPSSFTRYDEILTYNLIPPGVKQGPRMRGTH